MSTLELQPSVKQQTTSPEGGILGECPELAITILLVMSKSLKIRSCGEVSRSVKCEKEMEINFIS